MSYEFFIGRRYFGAVGKRRSVSFISVLSTAGVALGVGVMIVVIAVMSGAEITLRERLLDVTPHIVVMHQGSAFTDYASAMKTIAAMENVHNVAPYLYVQGMLRARGGISGGVIRGVDPEKAGNVSRTLTAKALASLTQKAASAAPPIILGEVLAQDLRVKTGDLVFLIIPEGATGIPGRTPTTRRFQVAGTFASGLHEFDKSLAYTHLDDARRAIGEPDLVSGLEVSVNDPMQAGAVADRIMKTLKSPYWAQDWARLNQNLFAAIRMQKVILFIILVLIILVAAFNIASSLIMMVMEKNGDIAILKAMGATNRSIRTIFVWKGMVIGGIGTAAGVALGIGVCEILERFRFIKLPTDVYFFSTLPVSLKLIDVAVIAACALMLCLVSTIYPSIRASRLNPSEVLRQG